MQRSQQAKIVGGFVVGGVLFAVLFARRTPENTVTPQHGVEPPFPLQSVPLYVPAESVPSPAIGLRDSDPAPVAPPALVAATSAGQSHLEDNGAPPAMPDMYQPFFEERAPPASVHQPRRLNAPDAKQTVDRPESSEGARAHRVVDGDTLARLARRYWKDESLAQALFAANRDVLSAPDPLPIGVTLQIPPRPTKSRVTISSPATTVEELPAPVRQPSEGLQLDEPLVPIQRP